MFHDAVALGGVVAMDGPTFDVNKRFPGQSQLRRQPPLGLHGLAGAVQLDPRELQARFTEEDLEVGNVATPCLEASKGQGWVCVCVCMYKCV